MTRDVVGDVFAAWRRGKGALLYGPPGTGKTREASRLYKMLATADRTDGIVLDPSGAGIPLDLERSLELPIPEPVKVIWTTFHQSFTYEDFIIGLFPAPDKGGTTLRPRLGLLLDAIYELVRPDPVYRSVVLIIDEVNRGNAARIFGEFLTFLDVDYRDTDVDGTVNPFRLPLPLRQVRTQGAKTEPLERPGGEAVELPWPAYFPRHVYVVGTMNSVDRAAVPLDSALARRFERIELRPELEALANMLEVPYGDVVERAEEVRKPDNPEWESLSVYETAVLLLDRLNGYLAAALGTEFELGHGMLAGLHTTERDDKAAWRRLARLWDDVLYPQLEDRFASRPEHLIELLKVEQPPSGEYAWTLRTALGGRNYGRALAPIRLSDAPEERSRRSLQWLSI